MFVRRVFAIVVTGLALSVLPASARADSTSIALVQGAATAVVATIACTIAVLNAEEEVEVEGEPAAFDRRGWFLGLGGSYAFETFADDAATEFQETTTLPLELDLDNSFGINGRAGYRCHRRWSAEVEIEAIDSFDGDLAGGGVGEVARLEFEPLVVTVNAKGYFLTGRYQPFLLAGGGVMSSERRTKEFLGLSLDGINKDNEFTMRFGGGIDLYATENIVVTLDASYVLPTGSLKDLDYISVGWGIQYRF